MIVAISICTTLGCQRQRVDVGKATKSDEAPDYDTSPELNGGFKGS